MPVDLAAEQLQPLAGGVDHAGIGIDQGTDQVGHHVQVAGPGEGPGRDLTHAGVAVGKQLAEPILEGPKHGRAPRPGNVRAAPTRPSRRSRRGGLRAPRASPRPPRSSAGSRSRPPATVRLRQVLGQPSPSQERPRTEPLDFDPLESS